MHHHVPYLQLWLSLPRVSFQGGIHALESLGLPRHYSITCVSLLLQRREEKKRGLLGGVMGVVVKKRSKRMGKSSKGVSRIHVILQGIHAHTAACYVMTQMECLPMRYNYRTSYYPTTHYHMYCHPGWQGKRVYLISL